MPEQNKHYNFFQNKECEYFPCHKGVKEEDFNCLFCYCPLYTLGKHCGGNCTYTESIIARFREIAAVAARSDREDK